MKRLVFAALITSIVVSGCTQKESGKETVSFDKKVTTETVELDPCNINVGEIRFTKSKNCTENSITLLGDTVKFVAGPQTDYFRSPDGSVVNSSAVIFTEVDNTKPFTFTAKVQPNFTETGTYSAGVLYAYENDMHCQKLCFEQDEYGDYRVVSVRTIGTSDDNNHQAIIGPYVYMRLSSDGTTLGSYFSEDGKIWHMARLYKNDFPEKLLLGLSSQSPKDNEHTCYFTEVSLKQEAVSNFRIGKLNEE
ncbi:regulation of enolase protein 1 (concanavalin A-like superfamily) [Parabacteroides sp. PFB2-12]|uniref:DUF1349 domain-containing protein n=1 Tax=unclassified Parabacteroides TaxID=2649774 RepID=UPI0024745732|nr:MULTISPECIES: DUF1349 domain-containing protein [unclassified Parabacteroides]MDH6342502.1 regulation of enolase protein 1 (concanavalin A-like superfamily) [Parabacteroides sp. PM6-13]MDH6390154.1 regulation of enolase protein 1 (concanavalin A-like superfamily) [Parabacteroides sp. PFB2-12]